MATILTYLFVCLFNTKIGGEKKVIKDLWHKKISGYKPDIKV